MIKFAFCNCPEEDIFDIFPRRALRPSKPKKSTIEEGDNNRNFVREGGVRSSLRQRGNSGGRESTHGAQDIQDH